VRTRTAERLLSANRQSATHSGIGPAGTPNRRMGDFRMGHSSCGAAGPLRGHSVRSGNPASALADGHRDGPKVDSAFTKIPREEGNAVNQGLDVTGRIRRVIGEHGHLPVDMAHIGDDTDLFQAGMTSHASVNLMLGLESEFDVEFPDSMLKRSVFQSVSAIRAALEKLLVAAA